MPRRSTAARGHGASDLRRGSYISTPPLTWADGISGRRTVRGDTDALAALRECAELLENGAERPVLKAGEAVFLDNYRIVHGRDVFMPRYDGTDRWLKRSILRDLRRAYVHTSSRSRVLA